LAMTALIDSGVKKKGRRDKLAIDQVSAVLILQSYMESKS
jgi:RNase H-fold protein (predicted Holliday junction resolvase)